MNYEIVTFSLILALAYIIDSSYHLYKYTAKRPASFLKGAVLIVYAINMMLVPLLQFVQSSSSLSKLNHGNTSSGQREYVTQSQAKLEMDVGLIFLICVNR